MLVHYNHTHQNRFNPAHTWPDRCRIIMYSRLSYRIIIGPSVPLCRSYRQVSFYVRLMFLKTLHKWNTKCPRNSVFPGY